MWCCAGFPDDAFARVLHCIVIATFNWAHPLHRVYENLRDRTLREFEWLVVDDGPTDDTGEQVAEWQELGIVPIRCFLQPHSGKHVARITLADQESVRQQDRRSESSLICAATCTQASNENS